MRLAESSYLLLNIPGAGFLNTSELAGFIVAEIVAEIAVGMVAGRHDQLLTNKRLFIAEARKYEE